MLSPDRVDELRARAERDAVLRGYIDGVVKSADDELTGEPLPMHWYGAGGYRHMLETSRLALRRLSSLGLAWRLAGRHEHLDRITAVLSAAAELPDWHPGHFLDTAEMMSAVSIGLAWAWDGLADKTRERAVSALLDHGVRPSLAAHGPDWPYNPWARKRNNWNIVCNGGAILAALAVRHRDPELAELLITTSRRSLDNGLASFAPHGAYPEGTVYWGYATRYLAMLVGALQSDLGTDLGILASPGIAQTALYPMLVRSPTGHTVAFGDQIWESTSSHRAFSLFFFASALGRPELARDEHEYLKRAPDAVSPMHVIWYVPPTAGAPTPPPATLLEGPAPLVVMRTAGRDRLDAFLSVKGGANPASHGNLDLGTFEYHALGHRWVIDLGRDDYRLPGYWEERDPSDADRPGARYRLFRCSSFSHSVPIVAGEQQSIVAESRFVQFDGEGERPSCVIELTDAYRSHVRSLVRHAELDLASGTASIEDRFELDTPQTIEWAFLTPASAEPTDRGVALSIEDAQVDLELRLPDGAEVSIRSAERPAPEERNEGISRIAARFLAPPGESTVLARFRPASFPSATPTSETTVRTRPAHPDAAGASTR